jgi:hypothetical protein
MLIRVSLPIEVEKTDAEWNDSVPVTAVLTFERGKWHGQCADPPVATLQCDTLEEALLATAREVARDWTRQR